MEPTEGGQGRCVKIIEWLFDDEVFQGKLPLCTMQKGIFLTFVSSLLEL